VHLERQMFPPTKEWKIFDGCLYLRGRYLLPDYTPSNYVISVLRHRENVPVFCRQELGAFYPFI
jgi:hypothetical protein